LDSAVAVVGLPVDQQAARLKVQAVDQEVDRLVDQRTDMDMDTLMDKDTQVVIEKGDPQ